MVPITLTAARHYTARHRHFSFRLFRLSYYYYYYILFIKHVSNKHFHLRNAFYLFFFSLNVSSAVTYDREQAIFKMCAQTTLPVLSNSAVREVHSDRQWPVPWAASYRHTPDLKIWALPNHVYNFDVFPTIGKNGIFQTIYSPLTYDKWKF